MNIEHLVMVEEHPNGKAWTESPSLPPLYLPGVLQGAHHCMVVLSFCTSCTTLLTCRHVHVIAYFIQPYEIFHCNCCCRARQCAYMRM
jgi:hypothetical protein